MKKILLTGLTGNIGSGIVEKLDELFESGTSIEILEYIKPIKIREYSSLKIKIVRELENNYDIAIHLAANSDINFCKNPDNWGEVLKQNVELTKKICEKSDKVIFISTDYVFDGKLNKWESWTEDEEKKPVNEYGKSKSLAEDIVISHKGIVLRVETMMGIKNKIIDAAKRAIEGKDLHYHPFWTNNFIRPSYFPDFYRVLKNSIQKNVFGIYHVSCSGEALSRNEMAQIVLDIYKEKGWRRKLDYLESEEAPLTKRFVLNTDKTKRELRIEFTDSREAIRKHVLDGC
mgnify:CR=1 FL=1